MSIYIYIICIKREREREIERERVRVRVRVRERYGVSNQTSLCPPGYASFQKRIGCCNHAQLKRPPEPFGPLHPFAAGSRRASLVV